MITFRIDGIGTALGSPSVISEAVSRALTLAVANHSATLSDLVQSPTLESTQEATGQATPSTSAAHVTQVGSASVDPTKFAPEA